MRMLPPNSTSDATNCPDSQAETNHSAKIRPWQERVGLATIWTVLNAREVLVHTE